MIRFIRTTVVMLVVMTVITGVIYPLAVTAIAQLAFPHQANGSLIVKDGRPVGSELIGQPFTSDIYFWPRPSATNTTDDSTKPQPYNAANSSGSNLGPLNPALADNVGKQVQALRSADPDSKPAVPVDLVTASASGLDGDISPAAAEYQISRVAKARHMTEGQVRKLVAAHTRQRQFGLLGEPRVNVLELNLALDEQTR